MPLLPEISSFIARVFAYSALRRHLTAQQQDKADEERDANNRRRSQRREILQQDVLLSCCLAHRRILPTLRRSTPPRMCLTQVPEIFVLLSNASFRQPAERPPCRALALSGSGPGRTATRGGHRAEAAPGHHGVTGDLAGSPPEAAGTSPPSALCLTVRSAARLALPWPAVSGMARPGRGLTDALSQVKAHGPDDRRSLRPRPAAPGPRARPGSPSRRPGGRARAGRISVL